MTAAFEFQDLGDWARSVRETRVVAEDLEAFPFDHQQWHGLEAMEGAWAVDTPLDWFPSDLTLVVVKEAGSVVAGCLSDLLLVELKMRVAEAVHQSLVVESIREAHWK